ncbi:hypothetical protein BCR44DRAFT_53396 [Catenaria anguillulae PL171]|uniref:DNA polymerase epsilon catalytic subunit n=1 Tax=Catenaria anguillulae PL171 TaxID=765915 RepID=A0A1Y2HLD8_9FUNG|nr:hypothetical protein BCR44DRAFT_53396 [Catenaria anguillulae PL171]
MSSSGSRSGTFGLVPSSRRGGSSAHRGRGGGNNLNVRANPRRRPPGGTNFKGSDNGPPSGTDPDLDALAKSEERFKVIGERDAMDEKMGFARYNGPGISGWMVNMQATTVRDEEWPSGRSAVDYYFIADDGSTFKSTVVYSPYFYLMCKPSTEADVEEYLKRMYESTIESITWAEREDLDMPNHLLGLKRIVLKLSFRNVQDLLRVRKDMLAAVRNQSSRSDSDAVAYDSSMNVQVGGLAGSSSATGGFAAAAAAAAARNTDPLSMIVDVREYDVPYYLRVAMDLDLRVGLWYMVVSENGVTEIAPQPDKLLPPDPVILAFDIETTKLPLKFPDASHDQIMMISYIIDGQGYLITNREIVSEDIDDFDYTPKPEFEGPFVVFNEANERGLLDRFFDHIIEVKPHVIVTYNGDFFDWPFVETRAAAHGIDMRATIGWFKDENDEYKSYYAHHSDAFRWVKRDSYLPAGSHGLKAVTTAKLGYNPIELDPELMVPYAQEKPQVLAQYSVSDAVATYYLYMKYVHPFVFSLCNIIPMNPDEVLRKGSGTLCESLLMVKAFKAGVLMPNKHVDATGQFYKGHLLTSESYVGGHVEALEAGVFRSDIPTKFKVDPATVTKLMKDVERALKFTLEVEHKVDPNDVTNFDEVKNAILAALDDLRTTPNRIEPPLIYHLDVAAMYPNIILTNRLQPDAMVDEAACASCDYNDPANQCQRKLEWRWRGEYYPADMGDYQTLVRGLRENEPGWKDMGKQQQEALLNKRLAEYSRKVYKRIHETEVVLKTSTVCQRENPFYIDTVRQFRDRRYEYKGLLKVWKGKLDAASQAGDTAGIAEGKKMVVVMDSLQLAHKCILNSFYGYVMRKGSRWYSMEMGGIVCHTGAKIIQLARELVEQVGRPLELDTDGIWCILPASFPENFSFKTAKGKKIVVSYPCTMLNHLVHDTFTNHQYQARDTSGKSADGWSIWAENSIFFEVDGPYKAMILPASTEEDKLLKKRYAVFNEDGSLAELKGFEVKRRGELKLIKIFQQQIFSVFLKGTTLEECYAAVAQVANEWLDIMDCKGATVADAELIDLISENKNMSKSLSEYEGQKSTAITTAKRLAELLGAEMVKDKLACHFLVCRLPAGAPVAERALPVALLHSEPAIRRHFLRKWLKDPTLHDPDVRELIDWDYYKERFGSVLQKLITIPAAMQGVTNPIPRVKHPDWLRTRVNNQRQQSKLTDMFDMEDMRRAGAQPAITAMRASAVSSGAGGAAPPRTAKVTRVKTRRQTATEELAELGQQVRSTPVPNPRQDYQAWLKYEKMKWRYQRLRQKLGEQIRAQQPSASSTGSGSGSGSQSQSHGPTSSVQGFLMQQQAFLESAVWQVLQVQEPKTPGGPHAVWVLAGDKLVRVTVDVPRTFFINSELALPADSIGGGITLEPAKRTLPRGTPTKHLYQVTVGEQKYVKHEATFTELFAHPQIQGVYETRVPGSFRAIAHFGAQWMLDRQRRQSQAPTANSHHKWDDLRMAPQNAAVPYLGPNTSLDDLYLYHFSSGERHMAVVYSFRGGVECHMFVCDPSRSVNMGRIELAYSELRQRHLDLELPHVDFRITAFLRESVMMQALNKHLATLHQRRAAPTLLTIQSTRPSAISHLNALAQFPTVTRSASARDVADLPALGWQSYIAQRWLHHLRTFKPWKARLVELAQFSQVPVGNLGTDGILFALDVMMARKLIKADCVLWYSPDLRPDLGGRQDDEHYAVIDAHRPFPEVNAPGYYPGVTVELDLFGLCVSTVKDPAVARAEPQLAPLVSLVNSIGLRVQSHPSMDDVLSHVYRWLTTPNALLYDPHATFIVFNQMKRAFMALITDLTKLNATVVYASFSRLIVHTPKTSLNQARAYVDFLVSHLVEMPQFTALSLMPSMTWFPLTWMDPFNYAGEQILDNPELIAAAAAAAAGHGAGAGDEEDMMMVDGADKHGGVQTQMVMRWNIADYLPDAMAAGLEELLHFYFAEVSSFRTAHLKSGPSASLAAASASGSPDSMVSDAEIKFKSQLIRSTLTPRLLSLLPKYQRAEHGVDGVQFPDMPGALTTITVDNTSNTVAKRRSPTLEFVKSLVTILGLDATVETPVMILRRNALDLIKVREFAPEAQFANPCLPIVVPQVMCTACQYTRDVDLTREVVADEKGWKCPECMQLYPMAALEAKLIELVENSLLAHQVQDLVCTKCRLIVRENLAPYCPCSGALALTVPVGVFRTKLLVIYQIAEAHRMELLREIVGFIGTTLVPGE